MATIDEAIIINPLQRSVSALGIIGNFALLCIILYSKKLKDPSYVFVTSIASSDLITSIQVLIIFTSVNTSSVFLDTVGNAICKIAYCIFFASYSASTLSLTLISIYRLNVVSNPHRFKQTSYIYKYSRKLAVLIWIWSILFSIPLYPVMRYSNATKICDIHYPFGNIYANVYFGCSLLINSILPGVIMIVCYICIAARLNFRTNSPGNHANVKPATLSRSKELAKLFAIITAIYMILSWPFMMSLFILSIAEDTQSNLIDKNHGIEFAITITFFASNILYILNPIMFMAFDKNINTDIKNFATWIRKKVDTKDTNINVF